MCAYECCSEVTEFSYRLCSQPEDVKGSGNGNGNGAAARAANQAHIMMSYRPKNRKDEQDVISTAHA